MNKNTNKVVCFALLLIVVIFGFLSKTQEMWALTATGFVVLCFLNLSMFKSIKAVGLEAELQQVVNEANATVSQLKELAKVTAESTLSTIMEGNFFDGMTLARRLELHDSIISQLKIIGVADDEIEKVEHYWSLGVGVLYHRGIRKSLESSKLQLSSSMDITNEIREFQSLLDFENWKVPNSNELLEFLNQKNLINVDIQELLIDFAFYEKNRVIRRREIFVNL